MSVSQGQQQQEGGTGAAVLQRLEAEFRRKGFAFFSPPDSGMMPAFLGRYVPDAFATRDGENILIEVKHHRHADSETRFADIRRKISGHDGWKLNVIYAAQEAEDSPPIGPPQKDDLERQIAEVRDLHEHGHNRAAFVLAWSLVEAALNFVRRDAPVSRLRSPGQIVQALSMDGFIDKDVEGRLREISPLRDRIVHGDLSVAVSISEVQQVLDAVTDILAERR